MIQKLWFHFYFTKIESSLDEATIFTCISYIVDFILYISWMAHDNRSTFQMIYYWQINWNYILCQVHRKNTFICPKHIYHASEINHNIFKFIKYGREREREKTNNLVVQQQMKTFSMHLCQKSIASIDLYRSGEMAI